MPMTMATCKRRTDACRRGLKEGVTPPTTSPSPFLDAVPFSTKNAMTNPFTGLLLIALLDIYSSNCRRVVAIFEMHLKHLLCRERQHAKCVPAVCDRHSPLLERSQSQFDIFGIVLVEDKVN